MNCKEIPDKVYLDTIIKIDFKTGKGKWKVQKGNRVKTGEEIGWVNNRYKSVQIDGINYLWHRIVYTMKHGNFPRNKVVDHINGNSLDNRVENLRLTDIKGNNQNRKINKNNKSGCRGVYFCKRTNKWKAELGRKFRIYLGAFDSKEQAIIARLAGEKEHNYINR